VIIEPGLSSDRRREINYLTAAQVLTRDRLFTFAAYNAGPGRVRGLRRTAAERGLNPNVWFNNVGVIAAERIGRETVTYVSNIYKYYLAYQMIEEERLERERAKDAARGGAGK
jgi:membrane-bound lytic murein transglycosylase MltF